MSFVYRISDPSSLETFYIGSTNLRPEARMRQHMKDATTVGASGFSSQTKKDVWLRSILEGGHTPVITVLQECPESEKFFWESFWADVYGLENLANTAPQRKRMAWWAAPVNS